MKRIYEILRETCNVPASRAFPLAKHLDGIDPTVSEILFFGSFVKLLTEEEFKCVL